MTPFSITIAIVACLALYRATQAYNRVQELNSQLARIEKGLTSSG